MKSPVYLPLSLLRLEGRYKWLRLPFGLNVSSEIFQKRLCQALEGLPGVLCIADDIIIHGKDDGHDENFERFLTRCCEKGIKLKKEKLEIRSSQIVFHGHILTIVSQLSKCLKFMTFQEGCFKTRS